MFKQSMKSKLYTIVILLFLTTNSFSEIVKQIYISGNERVNSETIKNQIIDSLMVEYSENGKTK